MGTDCGRLIYLQGQGVILVRRVTCRRKTCEACWPRYVEQVKSNISSVCNLFATNNFLIYSKEVTAARSAQQRLRRAGKDWVRIPLIGGVQSYLAWPTSRGEWACDVEAVLDLSLRVHDRSQRITGTWSVNPGQREKTGLRLVAHGYQHPEVVATQAEQMGFTVYWTGPDEFEIRGTEAQLALYARMVMAA